MRKNRLRNITLIALTVMFLAVPGFPGPKKAHAATASVPYTFNSVNTGAGGGYVDGIVFNKTRGILFMCVPMSAAHTVGDKMNNSWIPITDMVGWNDFNKYGVIIISLSCY